MIELVLCPKHSAGKSYLYGATVSLSSIFLWPSGTAVFLTFTLQTGPGSVIGIATAYGLDGPGIKSQWG
jgi:hypothetical protein